MVDDRPFTSFAVRVVINEDHGWIWVAARITVDGGHQLSGGGGGAGTYQWMSPEVLGHQRYSYANDAYSFGIVLWETASRVRLSHRNDISSLPQTLNPLLRA